MQRRIFALAACYALVSILVVSSCSGAALGVASVAHPAAPSESTVHPTPPPPYAVRPHDVAGLPAPGPLADTNHYWDGSVYTGATLSASTISVVEQVPMDHPDASNFYYVIMSVWDSANSYDQIGFANDYGTWGLVYSWTTSCAGTYYYTADAIALQPGQGYLFTMAIAGGGNVVFSADNVTGGKQLWSLTADTGGTSFSVQEFYSTCSGDYDYTDYEESYDSTQNVPTYDWFFTSNLVDGTGITAWTAFAAGTYPSGIVVYNSGTDVTIENEPFYGGFLPNNTTVEQGLAKFYVDITVNALATSGALTLAAASVPAGWSMTFAAASGTPTFSTIATITLPTNAGINTYYLQVTATDSNALYTRFMLALTVIPHVLVGTITASPASVDVGQLVSFADAGASGSGGYSYIWTGLPTGCATGNFATLSCDPSAAGTSMVQVNVTDSDGFWAVSAKLSYTVDSDPALSTPLATPSSIDEGQSTSLSTTTVGGAGGNSYSWVGLPAGCSSANALTLTCDPTGIATNTTFSITVKTTDANGFTATSPTLHLDVDGDPTVGTPTASIAQGADAGQLVTFTSTAAGGAGGYTFDWWGLPAGCATADLPTLACPLASVATNDSLEISVSVIDANGFNVTSASLAYVVHPKLALDATATPSSGNVPLTVALRPGVTGGSGSYIFSWSTDGATSALPGILQTYTTTGTFLVTLTVQDSAGAEATQSLNVSVLPALSSVTISPTSASIQTGGTAEFNTSISCTGGPCPSGVAYVWSFSWSSGDAESPGDIAGGSTYTFTETSSPGSATVTVTATLNGISRSANATVTITKPSAFSGLLGLPGYDGVLLLVLIAALVVGLLVAVARHRKRKSAAPKGPPPAAPPATEASWPPPSSPPGWAPPPQG